MKKLWMIPLLALTLAGCGNDDDTILEEEEESVEMVETDENGEEVTEKDSAEETDTDNKDTEEDTSSSSTIDDFEESSLVKANLPMDQLVVDLVEDNQNKRIILFENEAGEKIYKSIFIKNDGHLKIIDIANNQEDASIFEGNL